jgi:hypothetical protein
MRAPLLALVVAVLTGCGSTPATQGGGGAASTPTSGNSGSESGLGSTDEPDAEAAAGSGSAAASGGSGGSGSIAASGMTTEPSSGSSAGASHAGEVDASVVMAGDAGRTTASPFDCKFGWGEPSPSGSLASYGWLGFVSTWVGSEVQSDGSLPSCSGCTWLTGQVAPTNLIPVYYAYFIGFYGHVNGLPDQNQNSSGPNLSTGAGALILGAANSACPSGQLCASNKIVQMYAHYAQLSHAAWPTKPLVWLLEGDFVQYTDTTQTKPLTYAQLGQLAALITTAIKSNMPNAVVAIDQSAWNSDDVTKSFWGAMSAANYDMVWTTGVGNNGDFLNAGANAQTYNGSTATYAFLHQLTGKKILVDESAGMSQQSDTWSNQSASQINALIASGVVGINVSGAPSNYQSNIAALAPKLNSTCP